MPLELTAEQNIALMRNFVDSQVLSRRTVADRVYHDNPANTHAHLMITLRALTEDGFGAKKIAVTRPGGQPLGTKAKADTCGAVPGRPHHK